MRIKPSAYVKLNGLDSPTTRARVRETDNRDLASMVDWYQARAEALEREVERLQAELSALRYAIVQGEVQVL